MRTIIYCVDNFGEFHTWVNEHSQPMRLEDAWWFPEIKLIEHGAIPVHLRKQIKMIPDMVGKRIVTMSEHIILAFQKLVRIGRLKPEHLQLYCGNNRVLIDENGNLVNWPGQFFPERIALR